MDAGKDDEVMFAASLGLALRVERVSSHYQRRQVGGASALAGNPSGSRTIKSEEIGQRPCGCLFYDGQCWRNVVDMQLSYSLLAME